MLRTAHWVALAGPLALAGCLSEPLALAPDCTEDRCESSADREALLGAVDGFTDPVSAVLRDRARADGTLPGDYRGVLDEVGARLGCQGDSESSFVVLSNEALTPKTIVTRCSSDPQQASTFFLALPAVGPDDDVEPRLLHITAWDEAAARYRRYATFPDPAGGMRVNVEPTFCLRCHGGPEALPTWQPLMNVMSNPWSQWNAEPGFASHVFDDYLDPALADGPVFRALTDPSILDSASELEPIVRAGVDRVTGARLRGRSAPADVAAALELARPLFCDETVNFASEIHRSGEIRASVVVDDALRTLLRAVGAEGDRLGADSLHLPPAAEGEPNLTLAPVRGEATLQIELGLVGRGVLDVERALRVRALDWRTPVGSEFRCALYRAGAERVRAGALDAALAELGPDATVGDLVPEVVDELLAVEVDGALVSLAPPAGADALAFADATLPAVAAALASGDLRGYAVTWAELAAEVDAALVGADRAALDDDRRDRACDAAARHHIAPIFPDIDC